MNYDNYTVSLHYDKRLYKYDILGSKVHVQMLAKQGIISASDSDTIVKNLDVIETEIQSGKIQWIYELEDIHMNIESRLTELTGEIGAKLHTGRSRNDQIALDLRLYTRDVIKETVNKLNAVQKAIVELCEQNIDVIMPGYTHLQRAQPVLFAHHMLAYFNMFQRDIERYQDSFKRVNICPLGSGAIAGVTYNTDREWVAKELGFDGITSNSMDAVSDRDYVIELSSAASILMMHFSRLSEEIILWNSREFGFVKLDDQFVTGSSMMPQKKNPDFAELARGKTGRVFGNLFRILTILKGLPLTYNRDLQEDKEGFFDTVDTVISTLDVYIGMIPALQINSENMGKAASESYMLATDLADFLVNKGVPFRLAYNAVKALCEHCDSNSISPSDLTLEQFKEYSDKFDETALNITAKSSVEARDNPGGTASNQVRAALEAAKLQLSSSHEL
ncbi:MAG TPA: argininosuccinate lyase [Dehalococcoidia bacterium]|jgi:argininosuccinate lyase|nr:argininosuccinate lyase [Dehalococcoidia bacterium]|tara:strand:- start:446 stop:1789 length:1344 start_codon:yes stop_codon:yes gene_type:complete